MIVLIKYFKIFLLLTLYRQFLSLFATEDTFNLEEPLLIELTDNDIITNKFSEDQTIKLNLSYKINHISYFSIFSINGTEFVINSKIDKLNKNITNKIATNLSSSDFKNDTTILITPKNNCSIEFINIVNDTYSEYEKIDKDKDGKEIKVTKYNFVRFINNSEKKINIQINFNKTPKGNFCYKVESLSSDNILYIPRAFNFDGNHCQEIKEENNIEEKELDKINNFKGNLAFIFSINTTEEIESYKVTINEDDMKLFLIISIVIALIFAVITFFLIRRKQKAPSKLNDNDFYKEENKDD